MDKFRDERGKFLPNLPRKGFIHLKKNQDILLNKNFTAKFLYFLMQKNKFSKITDGKINIDTIAVRNTGEYKQQKNIPKIIEFRKPRIIFDKFGKSEQQLSEPDIKRISFEDLKRLGFCICSYPIRDGWFKHQCNIYKIKKFEDMGGFAWKNIPPYHFIEFDRANQRIRLCGRNASPMRRSEWIWI